MTDRFSKIVRVVELRSISSLTEAKVFLHAWVFFYGPPSLLILDNDKQFTDKLFQRVYLSLRMSIVLTTTYHPNAKDRAERFNRILIADLRAFIGGHPQRWLEFTSVISFAYNTQDHWCTGMDHFDLVLSRVLAHNHKGRAIRRAPIWLKKSDLT